MPLFPGATQRHIEMQYLSGLKMVEWNRINHHVVAGYGSPWGYFNHTGRASSTFWVAKTGYTEQYMDTIFRAEADLHGNDATISIETESKGEAWTEPQLQAIINLDRWLIDVHGIPLQIAQNSHIGPSSHGLSWHRLGVNGNFPPLPSRYAGRLQRGGGMLYSTATGKTCPVEPIIDQIHDRVFPALTGAVPISNPLPIPTPPPLPPVPTGIAQDGIWGSGTTTLAQRILGTHADGEIWYQYPGNKQPGLTSGWVWNWSKGKGSPLIAAMQRGMGIKDDGVAGPEFWKAFQRRMGTHPDGEIWNPSPAVKEFQRRLNAGTW